MTTHRLINCGLFLAILAIFAIGQMIGGATTEDRAARDVEAAALAAAAEEDLLLQADLAAARVCRLRHGEASFQWTAAGNLVCVPRRGKQVAAL